MTRSVPQLPSDASGSSTVRDFIYLDESKVFSYLAQIEGGLRLLRQRVESALDIASEETGGDKTAGEHNAEMGISPAAAAIVTILGMVATGAGVPAGLFAGMNGKYSYQRSWENTTPAIKTDTHDAAMSSDLTILHHAAFDLIMRNMPDKFVVAKGRASILTIDMLDHIITLLDMNGDTSVEKGIGFLRAIATDNICYVEGDKMVHAFLDNRYFTVPASNFISSYGSPSELEFTIVGLKAQMPGRANRRTAPQQAASQEARGLFDSINSGLDHIFKLLGVDSGQRVYPIAIFRDL